MVDYYSTIDPNGGQLSTLDGGRRHVGITSRGVVWATQRHTNGAGIAWYRNPGNISNVWTWDSNGAIFDGQITSGSSYSMFIDEDDGVHVVYAKYIAAASDGRTTQCPIIYRYGTLNADHSSISWSAELPIQSPADYWNCPDIVAHKHGNEWRAHIAFHYNWAGNNRHITCYARVKIAANKALSVEQGTTFIHDVTGAQTFFGKVSLELRHRGDGKGAQLDSGGTPRPDLFFSWTSSNVLHYARMNWTSGNTWTVNVQPVVIDTAYGVVSGGSYGGLYEHHRWAKTLYDPIQNRLVIVGFFSNANFSYQGLRLYEAPIQGSFVTWDYGNWAANNAVPQMIGGTATLDTNGSIHLVGSVNSNPWYATVGRARILRPAYDVQTRVPWYDLEFIDNVGFDSSGAKAQTLPYPQGEHWDFWVKSDNYLRWFRNNRGCNRVNIGGSWVRRPKYQLRTTGNFVPVNSRPL